MALADGKMLSLDAGLMLQQAAQRHGLEAWVDPALAERIDYMVGLLNEFGLLTETEFSAAVTQIESVIVKRLKVARDWALHPEILEAEIKQPFFVVGNARAGTTFAQSILALDEGHRTPRFRDVQHPSPPRGADAASDATALAEQGEYVDFILATSPKMMPAHPYFDQRGETEAEDEYVYSLDFHLVYPLWLLKTANMPQALPPRDPVLALQFHKNMLKQYQWKCPTRRWVGKGVLHQYLMPSVLEVYPDAVCFWMHRRPEEYIASLLELLKLQYAPFNGGRYNVQPDEMVAQLKAGVDAILASPMTSDRRVNHIRFHEFVADPAKVLAPIYEANGIAFTKAYADRIAARMADPAFRADRYGKFIYSLESFGLDRASLRREFSEYCDRFEI
jgi:Sulfotransferase family